jgi:hypothetical protein
MSQTEKEPSDSALTEADLHRVCSAAGSFHKGLYHLLVLKSRPSADAFEKVLRTYQVVFQLCITGRLLDFREPVPRVPHPDPAANIKHQEVARWNGFPSGHALYSGFAEAQELHRRTKDARHNMLYRPYMRFDNATRMASWEYCTLQDLLPHVPEVSELENAYERFIAAVGRWAATGAVPPKEFLLRLLSRYEDRTGRHPTTWLPQYYAEVLNLDNALRTELQKFQDEWLRRSISFLGTS